LASSNKKAVIKSRIPCEVSRLGEEMLASQKGLCTMGMVGWLVGWLVGLFVCSDEILRKTLCKRGGTKFVTWSGV
jgi:hypothetical protein